MGAPSVRAKKVLGSLLVKTEQTRASPCPVCTQWFWAHPLRHLNPLWGVDRRETERSCLQTPVPWEDVFSHSLLSWVTIELFRNVDVVVALLLTCCEVSGS